MANKLYEFDDATLTFRQVRKSHVSRPYKLFLKSFIIGIFIAFGLFAASYFLWDTPEEYLLKKDKYQLQAAFQALNQEVDDMQSALLQLQQTDKQLYRQVFYTEPPREKVAEGGIGGAPWVQLVHHENQLIKQTTSRLARLHKQVIRQARSFDNLIAQARLHEKRVAATPSIMPVDKTQLRHPPGGYGPRIDPVYKIPAFHYGMDFAAKRGTPIATTGDGVVITAGYSTGGYGHRIIIDHGFGYKTLYAHLQEVHVNKGQQVKRGEIIGLMGNSGKSVGPHLHYEVHLNDQPVNPVNYYFNDITPDEYRQLIAKANHNNRILD